MLSKVMITRTPLATKHIWYLTYELNSGKYCNLTRIKMMSSVAT
jgi:hypothetical protein